MATDKDDIQRERDELHSECIAIKKRINSIKMILAPLESKYEEVFGKKVRLEERLTKIQMLEMQASNKKSNKKPTTADTKDSLQAKLSSLSETDKQLILALLAKEVSDGRGN